MFDWFSIQDILFTLQVHKVQAEDLQGKQNVLHLMTLGSFSGHCITLLLLAIPVDICIC